ncbi:anti-sigma factor domain-containing protein, partial [Pseudactinotalea sp.]|uniref:anti-sigma factor domain-containing protein n=1 Tax=Pseudactinotalea sp. TaxID=1926260 RepID=UPI003B3AFA71
GVVGTVVIQSITDRSHGTVVASADLEALPGWDAQGRADVEERDGERVLTVDLETAPDQGYREVWLISVDLERLVRLGVLTGSEGAFDLPDGLDLDDFAIVDVSAEPLDGDPAHSGDSIVRGELG